MSCTASCVRCRLPSGPAPEPKPDALDSARALYHRELIDRSDQFTSLSPDQSRIIAIHESGHAVVWLHLGGELGRAGVDASSGFACSLFLTTAPDPHSARILTILGGPVAEARARGGVIVLGSAYGFALEAALAGEALPCDTVSG